MRPFVLRRLDSRWRCLALRSASEKDRRRTRASVSGLEAGDGSPPVTGVNRRSSSLLSLSPLAPLVPFTPPGDHVTNAYAPHASVSGAGGARALRDVPAALTAAVFHAVTSVRGFLSPQQQTPNIQANHVRAQSSKAHPCNHAPSGVAPREALALWLGVMCTTMGRAHCYVPAPQSLQPRAQS